MELRHADLSSHQSSLDRQGLHRDETKTNKSSPNFNFRRRPFLPGRLDGPSPSGEKSCSRYEYRTKRLRSGTKLRLVPVDCCDAYRHGTPETDNAVSRHHISSAGSSLRPAARNALDAVTGIKRRPYCCVYDIPPTVRVRVRRSAMRRPHPGCKLLCDRAFVDVTVTSGDCG